jgi:hypothetical protein
MFVDVATTVRWPRHPDRTVRYETRYVLSSPPGDTQPADAFRAIHTLWHIEIVPTPMLLEVKRRGKTDERISSPNFQHLLDTIGGNPP